jgi:peptidyl-prolyl cis-trans isomerase A (cyclophilin A)
MKRFFQAMLFLVLAGPVAADQPMVEMQTNQGLITIELFEKEAPESVANFLEYVRSGFYDGTIFHRVIDGFMIQGGGFEPGMNQKQTRNPIRNEAKNGLRNEPGTLAMARTNNPHSATAQFFINLVPNRALDYPSRDGWGYAVFGRVTEGFDIVQQIGKLPTTTVGPYQNTPVKPVIIESVRILENAPAQ